MPQTRSARRTGQGGGGQSTRIHCIVACERNAVNRAHLTVACCLCGRGLLLPDLARNTNGRADGVANGNNSRSARPGFPVVWERKSAFTAPLMRKFPEFPVFSYMIHQTLTHTTLTSPNCQTYAGGWEFWEFGNPEARV